MGHRARAKPHWHSPSKDNSIFPSSAFPLIYFWITKLSRWSKSGTARFHGIPCDLLVFRGIHQCLPALATAGNNIIFDHIIETKAWLHNLISLVSELDVFFVGVHCSLHELE